MRSIQLIIYISACSINYEWVYSINTYNYNNQYSTKGFKDETRRIQINTQVQSQEGKNHKYADRPLRYFSGASHGPWSFTGSKRRGKCGRFSNSCSTEGRHAQSSREADRVSSFRPHFARGLLSGENCVVLQTGRSPPPERRKRGSYSPFHSSPRWNLTA